MKKTEKYIYLVLGIILVIVIACSITYIIATNNNKTETKEDPNNNQEENNNEEQVLEDGVTLKDTYEENNTIIQEYEIILNGKEENLKITYTYSYDTELICHSVKGRLNNIILYDYNLRDTYNEETGTVTPKYTKEELLNINKINSDFNITNFEIIKGIDSKNYLVIYSKYLDEFSNGEDIYSNAYILNDKLEIINENLEFNLYSSNANVILQVENANLWYEDSKCQDELCHRIFKIEDNKIYYLVSKLKEDYQEGDYGVLEERVYTINDSKLTYEVINTYNITEMGNMI